MSVSVRALFRKAVTVSEAPTTDSLTVAALSEPTIGYLVVGFVFFVH
jgi:hypothetical protein